MFDLEDKIAVVTGSSRGIGRAVAQALAEHGAKVVISSRNAETCQIVAEEINIKYGASSAIAITANISEKSALKALVDKTVGKFGRIDVLVCNAATNPHFGPLSTIDDGKFMKIFQNNVLSTHWLVSMVAPAMLERRDGSIILMSSIGAMRGSSTIGAYNISKAADLQLARNLAVEFGLRGVRVNCIAPGLIRTDFARALWEEPAALEAALGSIPLGRIGNADDVAGAAVYLASSASSYMTGQTLVVDGGATIGLGF